MHLAVAVSAHGFGHGAQTATVLHALREYLPALDITVLSELPAEFVRSRMPRDCRLVHVVCDIGMRMLSALQVEIPATRRAYAEFHRTWPTRVAAMRQCLQALNSDLLLANVPYLPLAAAALDKLPAVALCSLNWAGLYRQILVAETVEPGYLDVMVDAYQSAQVFLCPAPSLPMPELTNTRGIGPLAQLGRDSRARIHAKWPNSIGKRIVLVSAGGFDLRLPIEQWPQHDDIVWIVPAAWQVTQPGCVSFESLCLPFIDVLASVDALIGKLGYGSVTECVCNGIPLIYLPRSDWPEEPILASWLHTHGRGAALPLARAHQGDFSDVLAQTWALKQPSLPTPCGADEAARVLQRMLTGSGT